MGTRSVPQTLGPLHIRLPEILAEGNEGKSVPSWKKLAAKTGPGGQHESRWIGPLGAGRLSVPAALQFRPAGPSRPPFRAWVRF